MGERVGRGLGHGVPPRPRAQKLTLRKEGEEGATPPSRPRGRGVRGELQPGYSTRQGRRGCGPKSRSTVCLHSQHCPKTKHTSHMCDLTSAAHALRV